MTQLSTLLIDDKADETTRLPTMEEPVRKAPEQQPRQKAEAEANHKANERAHREAEEASRLKAEAEARRKADEQAQREVDERARKEAEEQARLKAEAEEKRRAEEKAQREAEERARKEAEEQARLKAEAEEKRKAEEKAQREAEERARKEAEEQARLEAEAAAIREAEAKKRREADARARREAKERAHRKAEEKSRMRAEAAAKREAEKKAREEARAKKRREAEERARKIAEEKAQLREEAEKKRRAEEEAKKEARAKAKREAEERARKEAAERARLKAEAEKKRKAEEKAQKEARAKARREAEEQRRRDAEKAAREQKRLAFLHSRSRFRSEARSLGWDEAESEGLRLILLGAIRQNRLSIPLDVALTQETGTSILGRPVRLDVYAGNVHRYLGIPAGSSMAEFNRSANEWTRGQSAGGGRTRTSVAVGYDSLLRRDDEPPMLETSENWKWLLTQELFWPHQQTRVAGRVLEAGTLAYPALIDSSLETGVTDSAESLALERHAVAVIAHNTALVMEWAHAAGHDCRPKRHWDRAMECWRNVLEDPVFWDVLAQRAGNLEPTLNTHEIVSRIQYELPIVILSFHCHFAQLYASGADSAASHRHLAQMSQSGLGGEDLDVILEATARAACGVRTDSETEILQH